MTERISLSFDDFLRKRNDAKSMEDGERALFRAEASQEWELLKDHLRQITDGKKLGADVFEWSPYPALYPDFLRLRDVALSFETGQVVRDVIPRYRLVFSRRPPRAPEVWANAEPTPAERWWLTLELDGGILHWNVKENRIRMTTQKFAEHMAVRLVEYQQRYLEALKSKYPLASHH
jgi:hypothetical protein